MHLWIYKSSLKTDLVPLSEILPYKEYVHMYINCQVYVCYMCTYMYTYIHMHMYILSFHEIRFVVISYCKLLTIYVQKFTENFCSCKSIGEKRKSSLSQIISTSYMILLYSCTYVVYRIKLLWQITLVDFSIYDQSA